MDNLEEKIVHMVARKIGVKDGKTRNGKCRWKNYYYWDTYNTYEEAEEMAIKITKERKVFGEKIRSWISIETEGRIYPIKLYRLYFDKKMKLI